MKTLLKGQNLWETIEFGREPAPLRENPTLAQIKNHEDECARKFKALSFIHLAVSYSIFTRIMHLKIAKEAWDKLKEDFQGSERNKQMQILNLRREFESLKMKDSETIKEFSDKLMKVVNQIRLLGEELNDKRVVEKVLVSLPKNFESKISSLEDSRDLSQITLSKLINALQATK